MTPRQDLDQVRYRLNDPDYPVLLVEDNPADADLVRDSFAESSFQIGLDVAINGQEALEYFDRGRPSGDLPQLILLDLNLPRVNGREVLVRTKANTSLRRIPVIVLTSSTAEKDVLDSYELGASRYLAKQLDFASFRDLIRSMGHFWLITAKLPSRDAASV